jgi:hypothetical protein
MSNDSIVIVPFHKKVEQAINEKMPSPDFFEMMIIDYIREKAGGKPSVCISDGETTVTCLFNKKGNAQPKNKKHG